MLGEIFILYWKCLGQMLKYNKLDFGPQRKPKIHHFKPSMQLSFANWSWQLSTNPPWLMHVIFQNIKYIPTYRLI